MYNVNKGRDVDAALVDGDRGYSGGRVGLQGPVARVIERGDVPMCGRLWHARSS